MNTLPMKFLLVFSIFLSQVTFASNTKVDIEFKGKKSLHISDVCKEIGKPYRSIVLNYGQLECTPNFKDYGGVPLITEKKDSCDSTFEYEPSSGKLVRLEIKYEQNSFNKVLSVLSEKYGKPLFKSHTTFTDKLLNDSYTWEDSKGSYINLRLGSVAYFKEGSLVRTVERYCTVLDIRTIEMQNLYEAMRLKTEALQKNAIKENASKL